MYGFQDTSGGYGQPNYGGGYPPPNPGYPPQGPGYTPQGPGYPSQGPGYPPQGSGYPSQGPDYPPEGPGYPPQGPGYQPVPTGYQPQGPAGYPGVQNNYAPNFQGYGQQNSVIVNQPVASNDINPWMPAVPVIVDCPPGLEYLTSIDQIIVKQKVELLEAVLGFETKNKYSICNSMGQKVYKAKESSDCCTRNCCGPVRPFDMKVTGGSDNEVLHFYRPLRCNTCFCPCFLQELEVSAPPGNVIGSVHQNWSILTPKFSVKNAAGEEVLKIEGPFCTYSICGDVIFKVLSNDGETQVGEIRKQWSGVLKEAFTDSDNFGVSFPIDLDVRVKATLLGALFLIDFMFFEKSRNQESDGIGML